MATVAQCGETVGLVLWCSPPTHLHHHHMHSYESLQLPHTGGGGEDGRSGGRVWREGTQAFITCVWEMYVTRYNQPQTKLFPL